MFLGCILSFFFPLPFHRQFLRVLTSLFTFLLVLTRKNRCCFLKNSVRLYVSVSKIQKNEKVSKFTQSNKYR
jgi:hypothetical protein